jgi:hypothetical protein
MSFPLLLSRIQKPLVSKTYYTLPTVPVLAATRIAQRLTKVNPGTSVHKVHVNYISHVTLRHLLTHLGCVYNRSL